MCAKRLLTGFILLLLMASCTPQLPPEITATAPPLVQIGLDPALDWLRPDVQSCSREAVDRLWEIQAAQPSQDGTLQADVLLQWGGIDTEDTPAFILGEDELRIVVHSNNPLTRLSVDVLAAVFTGEIQTWNAIDPALPAGEIQPLGYAQSSPIQVFFNRAVLANQGELSPLAQLAPDPAAMRSAVSQNSAAIGLLPARWLDNGIKPLALDGLPGGLTQPILAVMAQQPDEAITTWLVCLQQRIRP